MNVSVVIPVKNESDNLCALLDRLHRALRASDWRYEIVLVDDGSTDNSFSVLGELTLLDPKVKVIRLWRTFGQAAAIRAGIDWSTGDAVVTLDGDLQNDPADIPLLLAKFLEGYDAVFGVRVNRQDNYLLRTVPSLLGNWVIRTATGVSVRDIGCTLRVMRRDLALALPLYGEMHRYIPVLAQQYGANITQIPVRHHPRTAGRSKYNLGRAVRTLLDLITVKFFHRYLTCPMHAVGLAGLASMAGGLLSLLATVWMKWHTGIFMTGNPLLLLSVMLELIGVQLISTGLLSEMMMRTYFESQGKKPYAVRSTLNLEQPSKLQADGRSAPRSEQSNPAPVC